MPYVGELPELVITSKTQTAEYIKNHLESQGFETVEVTEMNDEVRVESPTEETPPADVPPADPPADAVPPDPPVEEVVDDDDEEEPPPPATPPVVKKESGAQRYKRQRDEAKAEAEALKIEQARKDGELAELRRQMAERAVPPVTPPAETKPADPEAALPPEPVAPTIPPRPTLALPELVEPDINDPEIGGDFDKWTAATAKARKDWQAELTRLQDEHVDKVSDWRDEKKRLEQDHARAVTDRQEQIAKQQRDQVRTAEEREREQIFTDGEQRYPDFREKAAVDHKKIVFSGAMNAVITEIGSEDKQRAADLIYWISTHPDEAHALALATELPTDKDRTKVNAPEAIQKAVRKAWIQLGKVTVAPPTPPETPPAAGDPPAVEDPDPEVPAAETAPPAAPQPPAAAPAVPPAAPPAPAAGQRPVTPPPVKPQPITPVGSRASVGYKTLKQMSQEEVRKLHPDDYRKRDEAGEWR
jgi:hypothetical protein